MLWSFARLQLHREGHFFVRKFDLHAHAVTVGTTNVPAHDTIHPLSVFCECRDELDGHIVTYARNRDLLLNTLPAFGLAHIAPPDGAFYIYADIGHLTDNSRDFCSRLLEETGVATAPGVDFDPVEGHRFMRFSFAVSTPQVKDAIARLVPWFAMQARTMVPA